VSEQTRRQTLDQPGISLSLQTSRPDLPSVTRSKNSIITLSGVLADIVVILIVKIYGQNIAGVLVNQQQRLIAVMAHNSLHTLKHFATRVLQAIVAGHALFIEKPNPMTLEL
jgi:hypothetical protein